MTLAPHTSGGPSRVLVVDDERNIRLTLRAFLETDGYVVEVAEDAARALALLSTGSWDVVVTDIVMPGVSGLDLLKSIRAAAPDVQVIMMTGEPTVETAAEAVRAGARDYLAKPVNKSAILRCVATAAQLKTMVDEKRRLMEENFRYQQNLEQLVAERTQALQDANLRLESAMAELRRNQDALVKQERLSALGQMVSGIAHDFNNALMPIVAISSYFLSDPGALDNPEQVRADLTAIERSAKAAADVVRRLREFYRPDDDLGMMTVDLGKLADRVMLLTEPAWRGQAEAAGRAIRVINEIQDLPFIWADEPRLREALVNLVLNAVDAMPRGGVIRLSAVVDAEMVVLRVADTGDGMPEEVRKRCFEPFFSTKGKRGSGLGLAMVYGIVTRHGGQISIDSEPGRGTTFIIRLPLARQDAPAAEPERGAPVAATTTPLRILVIDDEEWARELIARFLIARGHTVISAASGEEALAAFRSKPADLVITDRAMPDMGGDEIAAEIKRRSPDTPVIMLSGFGDIMNVRRERPAGVDCVLGKPVTPDELHEAVLGAMRGGP